MKSHLSEIMCQYMEILSCMLLTHVVAVCPEIHKKLWLCVFHQQSGLGIMTKTVHAVSVPLHHGLEALKARHRHNLEHI